MNFGLDLQLLSRYRTAGKAKPKLVLHAQSETIRMHPDSSIVLTVY